jgi:hypothetical protein
MRMPNNDFSQREDVIKYREIVTLIPEVVRSIRTQNSCLKRDLLYSLLQKLGEVAPYLSTDNQEAFAGMINQLFQPIEKQDDILTADYLETMVKPFFNNLLETEVSMADPTSQSIKFNDEIDIELTSSGNYTMKFRGIYFHSNNSPENEALQLARYWDDPKEKVSLVWGIGLGYHVWEMLKLDPYRKIYVFEPEKPVLEVCKKYGLYDHIQNSGHAEIIYDPSGFECGKYAKKYIDSRLNIYFPTFEVMPETPLKESLKKYYTVFSSTNHQKRSYYMSFRENTSLEFHGLDELEFNPKAKKAIIVSAGPSLDKNYLELKSVKEDTVIIATAPTMRKLYNVGIIPDVVVISDTLPEAQKYHEGAENAKCPLVFSSTASVPFVSDHQGPKYILCPEGFEPAEKLAKANGWPIISTYGSVALTALALTIYKGFKEIIFIGQDLCYKGNILHADGTSRLYTNNSYNTPNAQDIYGENVVIPNDFALFKSQIETTIKKHPEIIFLNATEGGVHIEGTKDVKLHEQL